MGYYADAELVLKSLLAALEKAPDEFGALAQPYLATVLGNLADVYRHQRRYAEAESLYKRSLAITEKVYGVGSAEVANRLNNLAGLAVDQQDWTTAATNWRGSTQRVIELADETKAPDGSVPKTLSVRGTNIDNIGWHFGGLVKAVYRAAQPTGDPDGSAKREAFLVAQRVLGTDAAAAVAAMAARSAHDDPDLAAKVRKYQDLLAERLGLTRAQSAYLGRPLEARDRATEDASVSRLRSIEMQIREMAEQLKAEFPEYEALRNLQPVSVEQVQAGLGANEALILTLDTPSIAPMPEETFIWAVSKTDVRWVSIPLGTHALQDRVTALRCGLDASLWGAGEASREVCKKLLKTEVSESELAAGKLLPFDAAISRGLYTGFFRQVEDLIKDKHLIIVPSGALRTLPFQVLVQSLPENVPYGNRSARPLALEPRSETYPTRIANKPEWVARKVSR